MLMIDIFGQRYPNGQVVLEEDQANALLRYIEDTQDLLRQASGTAEKELQQDIQTVLFDE